MKKIIKTFVVLNIDNEFIKVSATTFKKLFGKKIINKYSVCDNLNLQHVEKMNLNQAMLFIFLSNKAKLHE
jgi:hypothetical protein